MKTIDFANELEHGGSLSWSPGVVDGEFDGLELRTARWQVKPLSAGRVESSFFENRALIPVGAVEFDSALLMRGIEHEWVSRGKMSCANHQTVMFEPRTNFP